MATPNRVQHLPADAPEDIKAVLDAARGAVDQELLISQRLDTKMQYQLAITGSWYVATQAFALSLVNRSGIGPGWKVAALGIALVAVIGFADAVSKSVSVWKLRPDKGIGSAKLTEWADRVHDRDPMVLGEMAKYFAVLLQERQKANQIRSDALDKSFQACGFSAAITTVELLFVVGVRLLASL